MKFRNALVAATVLAMPLAAKAQPITGLYIGAGAGVNIMQDENATITSPAVPGRSPAADDFGDPAQPARPAARYRG